MPASQRPLVSRSLASDLREARILPFGFHRYDIPLNPFTYFLYIGFHCIS